MSFLPRRWPLAIVATAAFLTAGLIQGCDDDDPAAPDESIALTRNPAAVSLARGSTVTSTITVTRDDYAGAVAFSAENLPTGVTASFNPNNTTTNSSTLTLTANASATLGTSNITVRGTGSGINPSTTTIALTVTAAGTPSVTFLAPNPTTLSIGQGSSSITGISFTRTNFTGNVDLTALNLPTGVTATFVPATGTGTTSTLVLTASPTAATGTSNITVRAEGTGLTPVTTTIPLTITTATTAASLSVSPTALTIARGANSTTTITINRTAFTGAVTLTAENLPTGVTATFAPNATTANSSVLTITVPAGAPTGTSNIIIRATGTGISNAAAGVLLTIT